MAIPLLKEYPSHTQDDSTTRPCKRQKLETTADTLPTLESDTAANSVIRRHPLGVRPAGNALTSEINLLQAFGSLGQLPEGLLALFLEYLDARELLHLGGTCRGLHAYCRNEELWRSLFVESPPKHFQWQGTWRSTYLCQPSSKEPRVDCSNLFSDTLHRPFLCAHIPLGPYVSNIPKEHQIPRLHDLTVDEFQTEWVNKPFILTSPVKEWPIYQTWSTERLLQQFATVKFRAESVDWPLNTYIEYMSNSCDESPLYLFDRAFAEKMSLKITSNPDQTADYWPPTSFGFDLFSVLGDQRPDHRWLIVGPARSGSTFHKDPNATSAWNAVLKGSKYWIMFPSSKSLPPPPGVFVSQDQSEVTSPLSIAEWLLGFHAEARLTSGCIEGMCNEGEVLHVPGGWYHLVLNLEPSIALTQNFVPRRRLAAVLQFLRDQKQSISGFNDEVDNAYALFVERLREYDPTLLEEGLLELDKMCKGGRAKWEELVKTTTEEDQETAGFSFSFGDDGEEDEVP